MAEPTKTLHGPSSQQLSKTSSLQQARIPRGAFLFCTSGPQRRNTSKHKQGTMCTGDISLSLSNSCNGSGSWKINMIIWIINFQSYLAWRRGTFLRTRDCMLSVGYHAYSIRTNIYICFLNKQKYIANTLETHKTTNRQVSKKRQKR